MAGILDGVDQRTQLAGNNRMELLLFRLVGPQQYGINVFKVREVIQCPPLTQIPYANPVIRGVVTIRGSTIPVMDLSFAVGMEPIEDMDKSFVIVSEYNRAVQGFLVSAVEQIINMNWDEIKPLPKASGSGNYLTAVTNVDDKLVEILDVEKVLAEVIDMQTEISESIALEAEDLERNDWHVLVVDDSSVARKQTERTMQQIGIECSSAKNGEEGLAILDKWANEEPARLKSLALVISDIEMPVMDGYTLTAELRRDSRFNGLYILLHTSLSGVFNEALVEQVGADHFLPKFSADELGKSVLEQVVIKQEQLKSS